MILTSSTPPLFPEYLPVIHPFTAALQARDHAALVETLADDVVLHSAVTSALFEGKETVADLYAAVLDSFQHVEVIDEFESGDTHAFFWRGRIEGRFVEGSDRFRLDAEGRVREITIVGRPLSGLATFLTGIGYRFARRRRGRAIAVALRLPTLPLPPLFALMDPLSRWLARPRGARRRASSAPLERPRRDRP
ncbi:MAG TPA: nuclear transport factor 2 family protein [Thermoleophilaceae bacterium]|nr:nuclear transport factor 2 family protein [Thermoleophilaceae bacterium]